MNGGHPTNDLLFDLGEQRLPGELAERLEAHLLDCGSCRRRFDEVRTIGSALRRTALQPPPALAELDRQMVSLLSSRRRILRRSAAISGIAAAVALSVVAYFAVPRRTLPPPAPQPPSASVAQPRKEPQSPKSKMELPDSSPPREEGTAPLRDLGRVLRPRRIPGDINGDGIVDVADRLLLSRHLSGRAPLPESNSADVNGDGALDVADLQLLSREIARAR